MLEMQTLYGAVSKPRWETDVVIIGGGPSATDFDADFLRGKHILAVNDAAAQLPSSASLGQTAVSFFSLDSEWVRGHRDFLSEFMEEKFVALPLETFPECGGIPGVTYLKWGNEEGLSDDPAVINTGGNSGYGALNLAYLKGARRIFLVGFDMDPETDDKYVQWIPRFRAAAAQLRARGVEVWNMSPQSHVDAFPRVWSWMDAKGETWTWETGRFKRSEAPEGYKPPAELLRRVLGSLNSQETASYGVGKTAEAGKGAL